MNSKQRVQAVLDGKLPDRVPVCLHNFLMASKEAGIPLEKYLTDPEAVARTHLHALEKYGYDSVCIDIDTTLLAEAMGAKRACLPGDTGRIVEPAINSLDEVEKLKPVNPERDGRIPVVLEAVRILAKQVGHEISIRGNADQCAFSLAWLLRGMEDFLMELATEPDHPGIHQLLEVAYQSHLAVHRALKKAGAHFTSLGDSPAGPDVCSPRLFQQFARPYEERLVRELATDGTFVAIHICGNTTKILDQLAEYPACGFELDYKTDARLAKATVGQQHVLFGNIDPSSVIARGTAAEVTEKTRELISIWKPGGRFILNAGCAIPATTPSENIHALVRAAKEFGRTTDIMTMTPRERWLAVLAGKKTDRLPTDYRATDEFHAKFKQALNITDDEQLWQKLEIDYPCFVGATWKLKHHPDDPLADQWGIRRQPIKYGTGSYSEAAYHPLATVTNAKEVHAFHWPNPDDFELGTIPATANYRILAGGYYEPFLIYCAMRGMELAFEDMLLEPEIVEAALEHLFDFHYELNRRIWEAGNGRIDFMYLAEDLGGQTGPLFSLELYRRFLLPNQQKMAALARKFGVHVFYHTDGAAQCFLPDLANVVGIEFLNPLQWRCPGMEREILVRDYSRQLVFHGGIDNQYTLPFGTVDEVRQEVRDCAAIFRNHRWICAPCHNIQNVTPVENVLAMYETARSL